MSQPKSNEEHLNYFNETFGDPAFGLTEEQYNKLEAFLMRALAQKDAEVAEAVKTERWRIWGEIVKLADDFNGDLDTNLDNVWSIMQIPPAITPKE